MDDPAAGDDILRINPMLYLWTDLRLTGSDLILIPHWNWGPDLPPQKK